VSAGTARPPSEEVVRRLCYLLHHAWLESRNHADDPRLVFDLADAMEYVTLLLRNYCEPWVSTARQVLADYRAKHPGPFDYLNMLDHGVPADTDWLWLSQNEPSTP
jgi:hypothetical protein